MSEGIYAKNFERKKRTPEQEVRFVEVIFLAVDERNGIVVLIHVKGNIGVVCSILIHKRKKEGACINDQAKRTKEERQPVFACKRKLLVREHEVEGKAKTTEDSVAISLPGCRSCTARRFQQVYQQGILSNTQKIE